MGDWADLINNTAQDLFVNRVQPLFIPSKPVGLDPQTGKAYVEGQPANIKGRLAEIPQIYLIGAGVLAAGLLVFLAVRK